ncbi:hypothetical protein [Acetobacter persici]|uniref:hypothetical protein n=1 Tax=Acetobacter persici TaxID=1076596 RepID=UPI0039E91D84
MISDEIKQSFIDIVHQETWKTASLTTVVILAIGAFIIFLAKNWILSWVQNKISHEFNQKLEAYKSDLQKNVEAYKSKIQTEFEVFKLTTGQAQDRRTRSNENEYNACIECWNAIQEFFRAVFNLINLPLLPNAYLINKENKIYVRANDKEFLIEDYEKSQLLNIEDKDEKAKWCSRIHKSKSFLYCDELSNKCVEVIMKNSIFINEDVYILMSDFLIMILAACVEMNDKFKDPEKKDTENIDFFLSNGNVQFQNIANILRTNLHIRAMDFTNESQRDVALYSLRPEASPAESTPDSEPTLPK